MVQKFCISGSLGVQKVCLAVQRSYLIFWMSRQSVQKSRQQLVVYTFCRLTRLFIWAIQLHLLFSGQTFFQDILIVCLVVCHIISPVIDRVLSNIQLLNENVQSLNMIKNGKYRSGTAIVPHCGARSASIVCQSL